MSGLGSVFTGLSQHNSPPDFGSQPHLSPMVANINRLIRTLCRNTTLLEQWSKHLGAQTDFATLCAGSDIPMVVAMANREVLERPDWGQPRHPPALRGRERCLEARVH